MKVRWQVNDGYAGGARYQYTDIPDGELNDLSKQEREDLIAEYIQDDFEQKITWSRV
jgi:hypothetical protein